MEENIQLAYLYDTYGELLNTHQREVFEAICFNDLSLSEIAEEFDISRQAAHDVYRRTVQKLEAYENTLGLVGKYIRIKGRVEGILRLAEDLDEGIGGEIKNLSNEILEEL